MTKKKNTIWITGASSGIGRSLAIAYGKDPVNLILSARNKDRLEKVKNEIGEPERIRILPLDLTDIESFPRIVEQAWGMFDGVDVMIHNGGISQRSLVAETPLSVDRSIFETNYFGTIGLTKCLLPYFSKRQSGQFVVVTSVVGKFGTALRSSYSGSKHALHGFFESLRAEHYEENIRVTLICPGFVNTNVSINALTADGSRQGTKDKATAGGLSPDDFARKARRAISRQKREVVIGGPLEVIAVYIKRFFPGIHARMIRKAAVT